MPFRGKLFHVLYAELLHRAIDSTGLSEREVARVMGVGVASVSRWVNGVNPPPLDRVDELAEILRVPKKRLYDAVQSAAPRPRPPTTTALEKEMRALVAELRAEISGLRQDLMAISETLDQFNSTPALRDRFEARD